MSTSTEMPMEVNGRAYGPARALTVVVCVDGCEYDYLEAAVKAGVAPFFGTDAPGRRRPFKGRLRDSVVHQPEQPVDRDRRSAFRARHLRQLFLRPRANGGKGGEVMMNDPAYLRAGTILRPRSPKRGDESRGGHGEGQTAAAARLATRRHLLLGGESRHGDARGERHRKRAGTGRQAGAGRVQRRSFRSSCSQRAFGSRKHATSTSCICPPPITCSTNGRPARTARMRSTR